uniref:MBL fold metallo-hydrolase n=1 Tax=uncultured Limnohabitans sp. TaxID=768543 RepID=UPI00263414E9
MQFRIWAQRGAVALAVGFLVACSSTTHQTELAAMGKNVSDATMEQQLQVPGPVELETVVSANWAVPLSGLLNLKDPQAVGLKDRDEPIQVFAHVLRHPVHGNFLVDTGVSAKLVQDPSSVGVNWLVQKAMKLDQMQLKKSTADIVAGLPGPLSGVFFTHLHIDHISGMPDIAAKVPLFVGTHESTAKQAIQVFTQGATNALLEGKSPLQEWPFAIRPLPLDKDSFEAVLDIFGDGSVYAIYTPGHTDGSTAYLVRSTKGPVLLVGDTSHTQWGWDHGVE